MSDRSFSAFLRAIRSEPGAGLRLGSFAAFGVALFLAKGVAAVMVALAVGLTIAVGVGYPYFRSRGRLLGGSKTPSL